MTGWIHNSSNTWITEYSEYPILIFNNDDDHYVFRKNDHFNSYSYFIGIKEYHPYYFMSKEDIVLRLPLRPKEVIFFSGCNNKIEEAYLYPIEMSKINCRNYCWIGFKNSNEGKITIETLGEIQNRSLCIAQDISSVIETAQFDLKSKNGIEEYIQYLFKEY